MKNKIYKLNNFKFNSESFERYKTDLAEYNFILEQQYKNEVKIIIPQEQKKKSMKLLQV